MKKLLLLFFSLFLTISCGGGSDGGSQSVVSPSISISGPSSISSNNIGSFTDCLSNDSYCIKLTANISDPQNRITTWKWQNLNTIGGPCYPVTSNRNTMTVPLYCGRGYSCQYSYDVSWWTGTRTEYIQPFHTVNVGALQCASGSAIDGYIQDANVFADLNYNFIQDNNEPSTTTNILGQFSFNYPLPNEALLILRGGVDSFTGIEMPENYTLIGYSSNKEQRIISPISTLSYFLPEYSPNESLELYFFDIYLDDPVIQLPTLNAVKVLETNMRISVLVESISKITNEKDYLRIYEILANQMVANKLDINLIFSTNIIEQNIKQIARADSLINSDIFQSASALSGFINSIQIDEEETYLDKFRHGMKILPLELQHFSNGKDIDIAKYITD